MKIGTRTFHITRSANLTLSANLFDRVRAASAVDIRVQPTMGGHIAADPAHLTFNATFRTEQQARQAAFLGMANRKAVR